MSQAEEDDPFYLLGNFELFEARKILPRLEEEEIRFEIDSDSSGLARQSVATADFGGYGNGSIIKVYIHRADESKFRKISGEFFKT